VEKILSFPMEFCDEKKFLTENLRHLDLDLVPQDAFVPLQDITSEFRFLHAEYKSVFGIVIDDRERIKELEKTCSFLKESNERLLSQNALLISKSQQRKRDRKRVE
jgi:hypothetical protein